MADDIVSWSKGSWDLEVVWLVVNEVIRGPGAIGTLALVSNFEPDSVGAWVVGRAVSWALGEVGRNWSL